MMRDKIIDKLEGPSYVIERKLSGKLRVRLDPQTIKRGTD